MDFNYETHPDRVKAYQYNGRNLSEVIGCTNADLRNSPLGEIYLFNNNIPNAKIEVGDWVVVYPSGKQIVVNSIDFEVIFRPVKDEQ